MALSLPSQEDITATSDPPRESHGGRPDHCTAQEPGTGLTRLADAVAKGAAGSPPPEVRGHGDGERAVGGAASGASESPLEVP